MNFDDEPLMSWRLCYFPSGYGEDKCCGSGSRIRIFFDPVILDEHPGSYFQELSNNFLC